MNSERKIMRGEFITLGLSRLLVMSREVVDPQSSSATMRTMLTVELLRFAT